MEKETNTEATRQYLVFSLGGELFALRINNIKEVLEVSTLTKIPRMPDFMRGVINLRGTVLPVIDLRLKFGMAEARQTVNTCIIIFEVRMGGEKAVLGAMVDAVEEVLNLDTDQIEPPPKMGTNLDVSFIHGIGKHDDRFILILDIDAVFSSDVIPQIEGIETDQGAHLDLAAAN
ncbi:MAG: chemotaxis protein CheW [Thermodesulfobacteriota bacterium]